ncbi:hypothetical protein CHELA1G11_11564 [Hyphomicrobiales bacterium]|jgi:uncharacterized protein YjiS (DUF1127 family)|nr:hypothetical protein CHELA1G11_11564 [Hyphomicrobiales bacterium]
MAKVMVRRRTRIKIMANISLPSSLTARGNDYGLRLVTWIELNLSRYAERRRLRQLDENALKDIGLSQADAEREASRWPWEGPARVAIRR